MQPPILQHGGRPNANPSRKGLKGRESPGTAQGSWFSGFQDRARPSSSNRDAQFPARSRAIVALVAMLPRDRLIPLKIVIDRKTIEFII